jgi:phytoene/squalene synthetase
MNSSIRIRSVWWFPLSFYLSVLLLLLFSLVLFFDSNNNNNNNNNHDATIIVVGVGGFLLPTRTTITPTSSQRRLLLSSTTSQQQRLSSSSHLFMVVDEESSESSSTSNYSQDNDNNIINKAIEKLILTHDPILLFVSKLLNNNNNSIRNDAFALYAWCRRLDEICDNEDNKNNDPNLIKNQLDVWQIRFNLIWETSTSTSTATANTTTTTTNDDDDDDDEYLMDLALINCIKRYTYTSSSSSSSLNSNNDDDSKYNSYLMTRQPFDDMINGMKSDIVVQQEQERLPRIIQTMEELETYAYQVAGTVGTMLLPLLFSISSTSTSSNNNDRNQNEDENQNQNHNKLMIEIGQQIDTATEPAICLGKAIQLVNILRDAKQDAKLGRIYLPQDLLDQYCIVHDNINTNETNNNNNNNNEIFELALDTTKSGEGGGGASDGYRKVVQIVSLRAYELLNEAEIGSKATLPSNPFVIQLFVQIIIELYKDYLDELQYNRHYDNICYPTNKKSNSKNNREDDDDGRVTISKIRKLQATFRAVIKIVFN